jgi:DNA-binding XRE family transcriptional regulator
LCGQDHHNELGKRPPDAAIRHIPATIRFLGYVPFSVGDSLAERLKAYRRIRGLSRKRLARTLGVDEATLWRWETGQRRPQGKYARRVRALLAGSPEVWHPDD